eukprot:1522713-Pleurochrysis_carterae.AAC.1
MHRCVGRRSFALRSLYARGARHAHRAHRSAWRTRTHEIERDARLLRGRLLRMRSCRNARVGILGCRVDGVVVLHAR